MLILDVANQTPLHDSRLPQTLLFKNSQAEQKHGYCYQCYDQSYDGKMPAELGSLIKLKASNGLFRNSLGLLDIGEASDSFSQKPPL